MCLDLVKDNEVLSKLKNVTYTIERHPPSTTGRDLQYWYMETERRKKAQELIELGPQTYGDIDDMISDNTSNYY